MVSDRVTLVVVLSALWFVWCQTGWLLLLFCLHCGLYGVRQSDSCCCFVCTVVCMVSDWVTLVVVLSALWFVW